MKKIILIDDDKHYNETLSNFLKELNYNVISSFSGLEGWNLVIKEHPDIVLTDLKMKDLGGMDVLKKVKKFDKSIQVILITAFDDLETTIEAMQYGAFDYIEKSAGLEYIKAVIKKAIDVKKLNEQLSVPVTQDFSSAVISNRLIGKSPLMTGIYKKIGKVSSSRINVLIQGESGTGKELVAKTIHYTGITKDLPFIAVNCSALPESLLESELFGHEKGAFTGAIREKRGKFELAGMGSIFIDEVSELSPSLQVKLLRVLQEREFEKVGGEISIPMHARIITATNKNLSKLVKEGKFREDLFYRINVFTIDTPPLRERIEDIPLLTVHFIRKINKELNKNICKIPYDIMEMLQKHDWKGNVRELENCLLQASVLTQGDILEKEYINLSPPSINSNIIDLKTKILPLAEIEKLYIKGVLDEVKWNKKKACKLLGIGKTTLYNKIKGYNLSNS